MKFAFLGAAAIAATLAFAGTASAQSIGVTVNGPAHHEDTVVHEHMRPGPVVVEHPGVTEHSGVVVDEGRSSSSSDCATRKKTVEHANGDVASKTTKSCE